MKTVTAGQARAILGAIAIKDTDYLQHLGVKVFGNKGRMWSNTACITNLDSVKDQCNPRLSHNHCTVENVGCPDCIAKLKEIACN